MTIKAASYHFAGLEILAILPLAATITMLSLIGLVVSARSLQIGEAVPVIAVTSAVANLCTIASGLIVFGEPDGALAVTVRMLAFALVIVAAALTPGPVGAAAASCTR